MTVPENFRKTTQILAPANHTPPPPGKYDIYPAFPVGSGKIELGYPALAKRLADKGIVVIDGYGGVLWENFRKKLDSAFTSLGISTEWLNINDALKDQEAIINLVEPFLGEDDPLFGTRFIGQLVDFFDTAKFSKIRPTMYATVNIIYGTGAALAGWDGYQVYVDVPKNEIQFRSRSGSITNLGERKPKPPKEMYKQFYFVDWVALNKHKARQLQRVDLFVDEQRPDEPAIMSGDNLRQGLNRMGFNYVRPRPWFEPGPWGGQWMKNKFPGLAQDVPNYAWSFELISPENGIAFESDGRLLEVSFDMLMYSEYRAILGKHASRYQYEFPIRYDFLDTWSGGNLSIQCHPRLEYIRRTFGETITQDEGYYILDAKPDAHVYCGFQESINPMQFRAELEHSFKDSAAIDITRFVNHIPSHKHDFFLIPNGTIHAAGEGNVVLEISATPYIFTFKMYDWMRLDLEGKPRPLNIDRAFENLYFDRKGDRVFQEHISKPYVADQGSNWQKVHLPTHPQHFYDVFRYEFSNSVDISTNNGPMVCMLVEGTSIVVETEEGLKQRFNYAETFIIPAAANKVHFVNEGNTAAQVVVTILK